MCAVLWVSSNGSVAAIVSTLQNLQLPRRDRDNADVGMADPPSPPHLNLIPFVSESEREESSMVLTTV